MHVGRKLLLNNSFLPTNQEISYVSCVQKGHESAIIKIMLSKLLLTTTILNAQVITKKNYTKAGKKMQYNNRSQAIFHG